MTITLELLLYTEQQPQPGADTGGDAGDASPPTRPKEVLTQHLISLKIITKNIFVLHTKN